MGRVAKMCHKYNLAFEYCFKYKDDIHPVQGNPLCNTLLNSSQRRWISKSNPR